MRQAIDPNALKLPPCAHPRPGQRVQWYRNSRSYAGSLVGHKYDGRPVLAIGSDTTDDAPTFEHIRAEDPYDAGVPNWRGLPSHSKIMRPGASELAVLRQLMERTIPPGITYIELAREIWARGYEIYIVGGTVRDALCNKVANDVDLITTIPLVRLIPLMTSMCRFTLNANEREKALVNGHIRVGGRPQSGDPFVDISVFKQLPTGDRSAVFGSSFAQDISSRDFTCNAVYYDPINEVLVDPSGQGITDIDGRILRPTYDVVTRPRYEQAKILIRCMKFSARGYVPDTNYLELVRQRAKEWLSAMEALQRVNYIRSQVMSKAAPADRLATFEAFRQQFQDFGMGDIFDEFVEPHKDNILIIKRGGRG